MDTAQRSFPVPIRKWAELLLKARIEGVTLTPIGRTIRHMHASRPGSSKVYVVDGENCTCLAGQHKVFCKHRALWLYEHIDLYAQAIAEMTLAEQLEGVS
jgi:hypothetical protein